MIKYMEKFEHNDFIEFLKINWNSNHIYVKDTSYFEYEFSDSSNFVLAVRDNKIVAVLGYLEYEKILEKQMMD